MTDDDKPQGSGEGAMFFKSVLCVAFAGVAVSLFLTARGAAKAQCNFCGFLPKIAGERTGEKLKVKCYKPGLKQHQRRFKHNKKI